jgi:hypothetical protein
MIAAKPKPARCMCGWSGMAVARASCPQCQRVYTFRITGIREDTLRAFHRGEQPVMWPITRDFLLWNGLLAPITEKMPPSPLRHVKGKRRLFKLTMDGLRAIGEGDSTSPAVAGTTSPADRDLDARARRDHGTQVFPRDRVNLTFPTKKKASTAG